MKIGIIGRHSAMMETALAVAAETGHSAVGTMADAEALSWIAARAIEALVIGGGVEGGSRRALVEACTQHGVRAVEIFGPGNLRAALLELPRG